jgi:hypothetical protein
MLETSSLHIDSNFWLSLIRDGQKEEANEAIGMSPRTGYSMLQLLPTLVTMKLQEGCKILATPSFSKLGLKNLSLKVLVSRK